MVLWHHGGGADLISGGLGEAIAQHAAVGIGDRVKFTNDLRVLRLHVTILAGIHGQVI